MVKETPNDIGLYDYEEEDERINNIENEYWVLNKKEGIFFPYKYLFSQWRFCIWCVISTLSSICRYG
ncbi:hypothetical protein [Maledivibacter halophilus]|uniref:hypothetical protein n=1 Tax=Maledivibacter halophilus TaxID=36842 RepID=UPI0009A8050A|nr:hypothetical protein [Maledivibacter halophilus]